MSHSLPIVPNSTFTEREGVNYVGLTASKMGLIWRELANTDLGIDGYLEAVVNGAPIGLIAVQVKSGLSYLESPNQNSFIFRAESKHVRYWLSYRLPVIIVVYDPGTSAAYWRYIRDYFNERDDVPKTDSVPIRFSKSALFDDSSKDRLLEIASTPDSTAYAMLALRASRYKYTQELLTQREMIELYGKRKWLGEWLPLDTEREQLLIHSALAKRGPAWFWFRTETNHEYVPYLKSGVEHLDANIRDESAMALAAVLGRHVVEDLIGLLSHGRNVLTIAEALATITDLTASDRKQIIEVCWQQYEGNNALWSREISLRFMSLIAQIGEAEVREKIVTQYQLNYAPFQSTIQTGIIRPPLLRSAGCLWDVYDLPELRQLFESGEPGMEDLAVVALAQLGEKQDCDLILNYIGASERSNDFGWLSEEAAHLFGPQHLESLKEMLGGRRSLQIVAHGVLPDLCRRLEETTLIDMLTDPISIIRSYAAGGLVAIGRSSVLLNYEDELLTAPDAESMSLNSEALTATGDWAIIDRLLTSGNIRVCEGVARGLRLVQSEQTYDRLLSLLQSNDNEMYDFQVRLKAAESLSIIGNEETLSKILKWLLGHSYENSTNLMASVLIYLDRKLYCPVQWPERRERDFSILRYSVTRDDYR